MTGNNVDGEEVQLERLRGIWTIGRYVRDVSNDCAREAVAVHGGAGGYTAKEHLGELLIDNVGVLDVDKKLISNTCGQKTVYDDVNKQSVTNPSCEYPLDATPLGADLLAAKR